MAGTGTGGGVRSLRMLTAVAALYALVLQALLGGIAALPAASPFGLPVDVHCLDHADGDGTGDPAAPASPVHHHACCCTAAQPAVGSPPPLPAQASIAWPPRIATRLVWRMAGAVRVRAPPGTLASARAPPFV